MARRFRFPSLRLKTFSALRHRNYRLLWAGTLVSNTGDWLDQVALNWLVLQTTGSAVDLGLVNLCRGVPILLFTLGGGVAADRFERRRLLMGTQAAAMLLAATLATLVFLGLTDVRLIFIIATLRGIVVSFNLPARHSLVSQLVPAQDLANAVSLNSATNNLTKIIGPLLAGALIGSVGTAACFYLNAASFIAVLWMLWRMDIPPAPAPPTPRESLATSLRGGFRYVLGQPAIRLLMLAALVPTFFGQPYVTMLTVFADQVFRTGAAGLGALVASAAAGSVAGALISASLPPNARTGTVMLAVMAGFGLALIAFALSPSVGLAQALLFLTGGLYIAYSNANNAILQTVTPPTLRGRVLSILFLSRGFVALGTALAGGLTALLGPRLAMASTASVIVVLGVVLLLTSRELRALRV